ncbi:MAG: hypothetical protein AAF399_23510 [Bacteroidota bacterium]
MILSSELTTLLQSNGGRIIDNVSKQAIEDYKYIREHLNDGDIRENAELQERIGQFYYFKKHRITKKMRAHFIDVLEEQKPKEEGAEVQFIETVDKFLGPENRNDYKEKHFMLLSQLLHLLDDKYTTYNKHMGELMHFALPTGQLIGNYQKRTAFLDFYEKLNELKESFLENESVSNLLKVIRIKNSAFKDVLTLQKRMDLLFGSASDLFGKGELLRTQSPLKA